MQQDAISPADVISSERETRSLQSYGFKDRDRLKLFPEDKSIRAEPLPA